MMRYVLLSLSLISFCFSAITLPVAPAMAQDYVDVPRTIDDVQTQAYISNPRFENMARAALNERPKTFYFMMFRKLYSETRQYDPIGEETVDRLLKLAFTLDTTKDQAVYKAALNDYQNIVMQHMAHLGVVMQALSLARTHERYGDPTFFRWLKQGLIRDIMISGDGLTLAGAYDVITMAEETVLFNYLGMRQVDTVANEEFETFYNMHSTVLLETNQPFTIFVNTTRPMRFLKRKQLMQEGFTLELGY